MKEIKSNDSKKDTPRISIVIACYNDHHVVEAVEHAERQNYPNKEIILVNDGSNKEITRIINSLKEKVDLLITQRNQGQSIARNNGIKKSTGKYILNWDSDDYFEPDFSSKAVVGFSNNDNIRIMTCYARRFDEKGVVDIYKPAGGDLKNFLFSNAALGSAMFRKEDWERINGYEEQAPILGFEDWEFYIRILKNGGCAKVIPEVLFNYRKRANSTTYRIRQLRTNKFRQIILLHEGLYKANFAELVDNLFNRIEKSENQVKKREASIDYTIGRRILGPLRFLKTKIKK